MKKFIVPIVTIAAMAFASVALAAPAMVANGAKGKMLTDSKGMTLYTFAKDTKGKSACNGPCAGNWPPLMAAYDFASPSRGIRLTMRHDGAWPSPGRRAYDSAKGDREWT